MKIQSPKTRTFRIGTRGLPLDGSCKPPIAALEVVSGTTLTFRDEILSQDGKLRIGRELSVPCSPVKEAFDIGFHLDQDIQHKVRSENFFEHFYA